jgi:biopolymer transport protein ExbD
MRAVWVVVLTGCIGQYNGTFGSGKTRSEVVHEQAAQLTPTRIKATGAWNGAVATKKIRVWGDDEHRAQHLRWQQEFQAILDDANDILAPQFGVRFVAELASWSYTAPLGATLEATLQELARHDPGTDVFAVVALTSSLTMVSNDFDQIGVAFSPGRHLVVRGYSDVRERAAMETYFEDLTKSERDLMFESRKHHKRLALLLHELGHTFGAQHAGAPTSIMTPSYSIQATEFDDASRTAILTQLDARLGRASARPAAPAPATPVDTPAPRIEKPPLQLDPTDKTPVIVIVVDARGTRTIDRKPVADAQLDGVFLLAADHSKKTRVYVRIDTGAPPDVVKDVAVRATKAGLTRVIVTED